MDVVEMVRKAEKENVTWRYSTWPGGLGPASAFFPPAPLPRNDIDGLSR
jgi:hypothetical protein